LTDRVEYLTGRLEFVIGTLALKQEERSSVTFHELAEVLPAVAQDLVVAEAKGVLPNPLVFKGMTKGIDQPLAGQRFADHPQKIIGVQNAVWCEVRTILPWAALYGVFPFGVETSGHVRKKATDGKGGPL
jgi:hypothetical protein